MNTNASANLIPQHPNQDSKETRRTIVLLLLALVFLIISASLGGILFASSAGFEPTTVWAKLRSLTLSREKLLQGESDNRINIVLLGMGGVGHDGATLTDTIIFASVRPSDNQVALLSIPRDLQVNIPNYGYYRINSVNAYAERDNPGSGGETSSNMVAQILNQPVHYYLRVDFKAFEEIVNTIGGINVNVERDFYDPFYPDDNFGYAPITFKAGAQLMNGERALQFVRSRHGTNGEGNDFARARRQQKVLFSLKERLLSFDILLRPKRIRGILESLDNHVQTNIAFWEGMRFANMLKNINTEKIRSLVFDSSPEGILRESNYNGAFVLEPKSGNWDEARAIAENLLDPSFSLPTPTPSAKLSIPPPTPAPLPSPIPPLSSTLPFIELQNGTYVNGLASRVAARLESKGFEVASLGNASIRDVKTTIVYDLTGGTKTIEFEQLLTELKAIKGEGEPLHILGKGELDFLIILGQDAVSNSRNSQ